jgi:hypothetical protein
MDIKNIFENLPGEKFNEYFNFYSKRYSFLNKMVLDYSSKIYNKNKRKVELLIVGPAYEYVIIKECCKNIDITGLGFNNFHLDIKKIINYDFNNIKNKDTWPKIKKFDLVIASEVIEHLDVDFDDIFSFFNYLTKIKGYLIIQTPNTANFERRINILFGKNLYYYVDKAKKTAKHVREYTLKELIITGKKSGFKTEKDFIKNYFNPKYKLIKNFFPKSFRDGITIIYEKLG